VEKKDRVLGIDIYATPPGKKLKSLNLLSGGERALTSLALVSAIMATNPAPFVVLDEVDAALDEANTIRFANILDELAKLTQFIVITHNRATMEKADVLYGVTMGEEGTSKVLSVKLENFVGDMGTTARR
jgi:chromosome segregation protein